MVFHIRKANIFLDIFWGPPFATKTKKICQAYVFGLLKSLCTVVQSFQNLWKLLSLEREACCFTIKFEEKSLERLEEVKDGSLHC
jgi:hypothetical protein